MEIDVTELDSRLKAGETIALIDVREPWEHEVSAIAGSRLIPMRTIPHKLQEIRESGAQLVVVYCHLGMRSFQAVRFLREHAGIANAVSLAGGIDAWSRQIDPSLPRY